MLDRVIGIAAEVGLDYDYDALQHTNTVKAHQLLHYAKAHGKQVEMKERLLSAYFVEGRHVGRDEDLADLAAEIGLDRDGRAALADEQRVPRRRPRRPGAGRAATASRASRSSSSTASTASPARSRPRRSRRSSTKVADERAEVAS